MYLVIEFVFQQFILYTNTINITVNSITSPPPLEPPRHHLIQTMVIIGAYIVATGILYSEDGNSNNSGIVAAVARR